MSSSWTWTELHCEDTVKIYKVRFDRCNMVKHGRNCAETQKLSLGVEHLDLSWSNIDIDLLFSGPKLQKIVWKGRFLFVLPTLTQFVSSCSTNLNTFLIIALLSLLVLCCSFVAGASRKPCVFALGMCFSGSIASYGDEKARGRGLVWFIHIHFSMFVVLRIDKAFSDLSPSLPSTFARAHEYTLATFNEYFNVFVYFRMLYAEDFSLPGCLYLWGGLGVTPSKLLQSFVWILLIPSMLYPQKSIELIDVNWMVIEFIEELHRIEQWNCSRSGPSAPFGHFCFCVALRVEAELASSSSYPGILLDWTLFRHRRT